MEQCKRCRIELEIASASTHEKGMLWDDSNQCWKCQKCIKMVPGKIVIGVENR